jgi:hypothetical protein
MFRATAFVFLLAILMVTPRIYANDTQEVLGVTTNPSDVSFPGLSSGPGFILPDSKLYPLDQLVQEFRLLLAFTPEQQARVHMNIAGERLAELRVMMSRNNEEGINLAFQGFEKEVSAVSGELSDAAAKGRVNTSLISSINDRLGEERDVLQVVMQAAPTRLGLKLASARQTVLEAKLKVAEFLPEDQFASVIVSDLDNEINSEVLGVQTAAGKLEQKFTSLDSRASLSSEQRMKYEELLASKSALKKDYLEKRKKLVQEYIDKRKKLQEERKKLYEQIKVLMQNLQANQKALKQLEQSQNSLNSGVSLSITPTATPASPSN